MSLPSFPTPGLPDEATLARLANEFFSALPGSLPSGPDTQLPGEPTPATAAAPYEDLLASQRTGSTATLVPAPLPLEVPGGGAPTPGLEVPRRSSVSAPHVGPAGSPGISPGSVATSAAAPPHVPFYFLAERGIAPSGPSERSIDPALADPAGSGFYFLGGRGGPTVDVPRLGAGAHPAFDVHAVRRDFPILSERVNGRPLVWLDNAATTQKPRAVIERISYFYEHENSNIHRAAHALAARATDAYEGARNAVARFFGAGSSDDIVFVRGATEGINLIAQSWGRKHIGEGDEIVISHLEHHANIVPWQLLAAEKGARLRVIPVDDHGQILLEEYSRLLNPRTKLVAVTHVSNALGTVVPVREVVELGHRAGACVLIDGAQSVPHLQVDLRQLDADFFVFSGHKIFGPTGIGVVYGKPDVLASMPPWQSGGNMIRDVTLERALFQDPPARFEAGTGNIADAVGLGAALDYLDTIGMANIAAYEHQLLLYALDAMATVPGLRPVGTAADKASVLSFVLDGYEPEQVGDALNREGIAVRSGHHCAQPILRRFGLEATVRPSLAFYNTCDEVDQLVAALHRLAANRGRSL